MLFGVPADRFATASWGLATMIGALAGVLVAHTNGLSPSLMSSLVVFALAAAILGGLSSPVGAVVAALLIGVALNVVGITAWLGSSDLRLLWAFLAIGAVLTLRPQGLLGALEPRRV